MAGFRCLTPMAVLAALTGIVNGYPVTILTARHSKLQASSGLMGIDILQFALISEYLEAAFYKEGFAKFQASDFQALGFDDKTIAGLAEIGETEATHVQVDDCTHYVAPVPPCNYNFNISDTATMVATAKVLEAVGVSAYLGAAPLVEDSAILYAASSIVTWNQSIKHPFGPLVVIHLFHKHLTWPSELAKSLPLRPSSSIHAHQRQTSTFKCSLHWSLTMPRPPWVDQNGVTTHGTTFCTFATGSQPVQFTPVQGGTYTVPMGITGEVFVTLINDATDDKVIAGPTVLTLS